MAYCNYLYIFAQNKLKMKRIFILTIVAAISFNHAIAQTDSTSVKPDSTTTVKAETSILSPSDSVFFEFFDYVATDFAQRMHPEYKLYQTENTYNLIKLNTATGQLWQVQYGMNSSSTAMEVPIDNTCLSVFSYPGRYELYPTKNMYTFILLDTEEGYTYQVQWNTDPKKRFRVRIY